MMSKIIRIIAYWVAALVVALIGMPVTTMVVYLFLEVAGLYELGQMTIFQIGLALFECGCFMWTASKMSETILYDEENLELYRLEIFEELD